eukprot:2572785-Alexandrium_andersonii.AAC.1
MCIRDSPREPTPALRKYRSNRVDRRNRARRRPNRPNRVPPCFRTSLEGDWNCPDAPNTPYRGLSASEAAQRSSRQANNA